MSRSKVIILCGADKLQLLQKARVITAIKTPYTANGKFDLVAFDQIVEQQIENNVDGLIIGGTTGEGQLMSWDEHVMLIAHTARVFGDDILVIGNTGKLPVPREICCYLRNELLELVQSSVGVLKCILTA